jgi:glycosyltransferase involved in cell wall biosynthesis
MVKISTAAIPELAGKFNPTEFDANHVKLLLENRDATIKSRAAQLFAAAIPADRISVVPLGIDFAGYERHVPSAGRPALGYFARIAPEKGLLVLADAYIALSRQMGKAAPTFEAAGYLAPSDQGYLERVRQRLAAAGCLDAFTYHVELDRPGKLAFLRRLDVLSVPATYDEPKGMFLLEAMASGVPVVQPRRGAFTEIVERTGGGLLVDPKETDALSDGIARVLTDRALAGELSRRAYEGVRAHYSIAASAARLLDVYTDVVAGR